MATSNMTKPELQAKNLTILEDQLNHEALANKKCDVFSNMFTDPTIKNTVHEIAQHHRQHFENLLQYLQSHQ